MKRLPGLMGIIAVLALAVTLSAPAAAQQKSTLDMVKDRGTLVAGVKAPSLPG